MALVVCAVEAHFEFGAVGWIRFDQVHCFEVLFTHLAARGLVDAGEGCHGLGGVVEGFVVLFDVRRVPMGYGDVVGEFGGAEDAGFAVGGGWGEDAFSGIGAA